MQEKDGDMHVRTLGKGVGLIATGSFGFER